MRAVLRRASLRGCTIPMLCALLLPVASSATEIWNPDQPQEGEWDLAPRKIWEVDRVAGEAFGIPAELRVMKDGTCVFHDFQKHISHILDGAGGFNELKSASTKPSAS